MTPSINETHDPSLKSWVASANTDASDFPVQNLPYASFRRKGSSEPFRVGAGDPDLLGRMVGFFDGGSLGWVSLWFG
jgi:fumarylacetoacetase